MKQFSKLALLLGFISVIGLHGQSVWASSSSSSSSQADAQIDVEARPEKIGSLMATYFTDDRAPSPLSGTDAGSQLVNTVAGYMRAGDGETLHRLFYKPDANAWSALYKQVTRGQEFSTLNLVTFLDQTKTNLFNAYKGVKRIVDGEAYLYVATLFDNAMQQIFTGCWGFSDKPTPIDVINKLKGVYGRVVCGLLPVMSKVGFEEHCERLEKQRQESTDVRIQGHFTALLECSAVSIYSMITSQAKSEAECKEMPDVSSIIQHLNNDFGLSLSENSFEETLSLVRFQNPLVRVNCYDENVYAVSAHLLNPPDFMFFATGNLKKIAKTVKYGLGLKTLTDEQITNLTTVLPKDEESYVSEKLEILRHAFLLPGMKVETMGTIATKFVLALAPSDSDWEANTYEVLSRISDVISLFDKSEGFLGNLDVPIKKKKLSFIPDDQELILGTYGRCLKKSMLPRKLVEKWKELLTEPSIFGNALFPMVLHSCESIITEASKKEDIDEIIAFLEDSDNELNLNEYGRGVFATFKEMAEKKLKALPADDELSVSDDQYLSNQNHGDVAA